ncbi:MAG: peptidylprolyl isomerase [Rhodospirillales bacterium]
MSSIRASHILITPRSAGGEAEAKEAAAKLKAEIEGGADFANIAAEHSDCPSGRKGGDLGSFTRGQMVQPFEEAAFGLEVGELSDIVETQFGFHLIQRTG